MAHYSTTIILSSIRELIQGKPSCDPQCPRIPSAFIHILDNDSLLDIFFLCRPALSDEKEEDAVEILGGRKWNDERWWYRLVQVCRRWRYLVLESASFLGLSLLCTYGTPIADMLARLPHLPLILDYCDPYDYITADDEPGIMFALEYRDRVRRIRIMQPVPVMERLVKALHGEFPNLEYLFIECHPYHGPKAEYGTIVDIPKAFRAPRLRYLVVMGFHIPIGSPLFTTTGNPVALELIFDFIDYFHPNALLQQLQLSVVPQRETPGNTFNPYLPSDDIDRQSSQRAIMRRVTPYLRPFRFQGANAYLDMLLPLVTIRLLESLQLYFFDQLTYYLISHQRHFMSTIAVPRPTTVTLTFHQDHSRVYSCLDNILGLHLTMGIGNRHLDRQVARTAQVFHMLRTVFSVVEHLVLKYDRHTISSEWNNEADCTQWRELFRTFGSAKTLYMEYGLIGQISCSLQPDEGESPMDLLPELQELLYSALEPSDDAFSPFMDARQKAGHPVTVIHR